MGKSLAKLAELAEVGQRLDVAWRVLRFAGIGVYLGNARVQEHAMSSVRWNIAVSTETDRSVRSLLASGDASPNDGLSHFVERAVRSYLFEHASERARNAGAAMGKADLADLIDEAVEWSRHS